jgi:uncharacterized repeat protein (TIGR01451 family)
VTRLSVRLAACAVLIALMLGIAIEPAAAASTKSVDQASPSPGQPVTYTIAIDEASDQHNGRAINSVTITDEIVAPFTFVSVSCSLSCTATSPAVGASGTVTISGFGLDEGPHDPNLTGTVTLVVAAPDAVGASFTNQACLDVFVTPTMSDPQFCISAPAVTTVDAPTATATGTASSAATATETVTATNTATATVAASSTVTIAPSATVTSTLMPTSSPAATSEPTSTSTAAPVAPTATVDPDSGEASLGDAVSSGDDITTLPSTGTQTASGRSDSDLIVIALLCGLLAVVATARRFARR